MSQQPTSHEFNLPLPGEQPDTAATGLEMPVLSWPQVSTDSVEISRDSNTWELGPLVFANEAPPTIKPDHFTEEGFNPELEDVAKDTLRRALGGNLPGLFEDPIAELPHMATLQELGPVTHVEAPDVNVDFIAEEAQAATANLGQFNTHTVEFVDLSRRQLEQKARELATLAALHTQFEDWAETAISNNEMLAAKINEQFGMLIEQNFRCDEIYERSESLQAQLNMLGAEIGRLDVHDQTLERTIADAQRNANATRARFDALHARVNQILDVASGNSFIQPDDIEKFRLLTLAQSPQEHDYYRTMIQHAIADPYGTEAAFVRQKIVESFTARDGLRSVIVEEQEATSDFIQLKNAQRAKNEADVDALLERQAQFGQQLLELVVGEYNPALDELSRICDELSQYIGLANSRNFRATSLPAQIEAAVGRMDSLSRRKEIDALAAARPQIEGQQQPATREESRALQRQQEQQGRLGKLATRLFKRR